MRDDDIRSACFASLDVLCAKHGPELPYSGGLDHGFAFRGRRIPFLNYQKGIYRSGAQRGPAALSVNTSYKSPYDDQETPDGFTYAYRSGAIDQPDNRALRAAYELQVPIVYFVGTRPGWYSPEWPVFVTADDPLGRCVRLVSGRMVGPFDEREPLLPEDPIERRYAVRETRARLHQARFRARVLPAYLNQGTICRLKETRLLDAAHIARDTEVAGEPTVKNGLSLCSIHHRAFDEELIGVTPDYVVRVHPRLREEEDGPMLDLLKGAHETAIVLPRRNAGGPIESYWRSGLRGLRFLRSPGYLPAAGSTNLQTALTSRLCSITSQSVLADRATHLRASRSLMPQAKSGSCLRALPDTSRCRPRRGCRPRPRTSSD